MSISLIRMLFIVSGVYDGVLGLAFVFAPAPLFRLLGITPPNHFGYVQFPALLLIIFAAIFFRIAADPVARRDQLFYGIALKASYAGIVFWYQLHGGLPWVWIPFAYVDLVFLLLYVVAWGSLSTHASQTPAEAVNKS